MLWLDDNCNCWSTNSLLCSNMRRSPCESYELIGWVVGISASWAGGPGFRRVCRSGVFWQVACDFPQSLKANVGILPRNIYFILFIYTVWRKMIIWLWLVKNVEGISHNLCQHIPEETGVDYEQSGYSEANDYTWHC
jgi:hypothetical protein